MAARRFASLFSAVLLSFVLFAYIRHQWLQRSLREDFGGLDRPVLSPPTGFFGQRISVRCVGLGSSIGESKPLVVLHHAWGNAGAFLFRPLQDELLLKHGIPSCAYDRPGYGLSPVRETKSDDMRKDIGDWMEAVAAVATQEIGGESADLLDKMGTVHLGFGHGAAIARYAASLANSGEKSKVLRGDNAEEVMDEILERADTGDSDQALQDLLGQGEMLAQLMGSGSGGRARRPHLGPTRGLVFVEGIDEAALQVPLYTGEFQSSVASMLARGAILGPLGVTRIFDDMGVGVLSPVSSVDAALAVVERELLLSDSAVSAFRAEIPTMMEFLGAQKTSAIPNDIPVVTVSADDTLPYATTLASTSLEKDMWNNMRKVHRENIDRLFGRVTMHLDLHNVGHVSALNEASLIAETLSTAFGSPAEVSA